MVKHSNKDTSKIIKFSKYRKAQAWSVDLIMAMLVFVLIIVVFYTLIGGERDSKIVDYSDKADLIAERLFAEGLVNPDTGEFNEDVFLKLAEEDYDGLKDRLGIIGDFCLFIETNENPSRVKFIINESGQGWSSIGSPDLNITDFQCGSKWP